MHSIGFCVIYILLSIKTRIETTLEAGKPDDGIDIYILLSIKTRIETRHNSIVLQRFVANLYPTIH